MGWFRRSTNDPAELNRVKSEIADLRSALEARDQRRGGDGAADSTDGNDDATPTAPAAVDPELVARLDTFAARLGELDTRIDSATSTRDDNAPAPYDDDAITARLDELAAKLGDLDARITAVSTELANQVTELSDDIEALAAQPAGDGGVGEVVIGELRDGQSRLANEQARYQIAFREDLARLAEQVRRPGSNS